MILSDTTHQVRDQLVIVSKLKIKNDRYLTGIEKDWIDSIITNATMLIAKLDIPENLATERDEPRRNRLKSLSFLQQTKSTIQASPLAAQNLTQLLVVAQTLNSATSLLSCCYERHKWSARQIKPIPLIEDDFDSDLAQLLDRRRSRGRDRVSQLVRIASMCLKDSQASDTISINSDERLDSMRSPTESVASGSSLVHSEPEGMLSLIIVESIDNWKRNAEMALEVATQQSTPSNMSEESLVRTTKSFGQQSRYDYIDNGSPGLKHSIREEPYEESNQTTAHEIVTNALPREQSSHSYNIHTGPQTFSIRRKPPSRYSSDHLMQKSYQTNNIPPPRPYDYHPSSPTSQSSQSSQGPPMTPPPPPPSSIVQQVHSLNNKTSPDIYSAPNSPSQTYSSRILQSTPVTSGTARLVQLHKPGSSSGPRPNTNTSQHLNQYPASYSHSSSSRSDHDHDYVYTSPSGLNISPNNLRLSGSPRSDSSETIVCSPPPSGSLGSTRTSDSNINPSLNSNINMNMNIKRISRGRAWLERQVEAH